MPHQNYSCTAVEQHILEQIKAWPGIPAVVTYYEDGRWSVQTEPEEVERRIANLKTTEKSDS